MTSVASRIDVVSGIEAVRERIHVLIERDGEQHRRHDLEKAIIDEGQK